MNCLIVESNADLGRLWQRHLERLGITVTLALTGARALNLIESQAFDVVVLDLLLDEGSALAIADFADFRQPNVNVVFVTNTTFFSDGSIFNHAANACAFVESSMPPDDLAAIVHHYGGTTPARAVHPN